VAAFYAHPVWLVNGIFTEVDAVSNQHRAALARFVAAQGESPVVDFGGGYGTLGRLLAAAVPAARIEVVDPYPSVLARSRSAAFPNLAHVSRLPSAAGTVIAQDVLEHVDDPVELAAQLVAAARVGALLVFANCFEPSIKCHLPQTFHLQQTFTQLMRLLGCRPLGPVPGCEHALAFRKRRDARPGPGVLAAFEWYSRNRARLRKWLRRQRVAAA
jgi:hypothetical protein